MAKESTTSGGTSICGLLGVAFIVLKLCHVIDWGWLWVLSPFWITGAVFLVTFAIAICVYATLDHRRDRDLHHIRRLVDQAKERAKGSE